MLERGIPSETGVLMPVPQVRGRDCGIDAGEVLSMNVETVETSGVDASSPDFAKVVNGWGKYGQKTFMSCFADPSGYILSKRNPAVTNAATMGYYTDVTSLEEGGETPEQYYLVKRVRNDKDNPGYDSSITAGALVGHSVGKTVPKGTKTTDLLDPNGPYKLSGSIYSYVTGGRSDGSRDDYAGWYGTGIFNPDEYSADNIHASFKLVKGGRLNEGFSFMVTQSEDTYTPMDSAGNPHSGVQARSLSGYFMNFSNHNNNGLNERTLWRFDNWRLDNSFSAPNTLNKLRIWCESNSATNKEAWRNVGASYTTDFGERVTLLAKWSNSSNNIDYDVSCDSKGIKITASDVGTVADIGIEENDTGTSTTYKNRATEENITTLPLPSLAQGTYGFWGNNCEQGAESLITNLNVAITKTKSFGDIVYEPSWTDGALHMLINMDTKSDT